MEFNDVVRTRRSVRVYQTDLVPPDIIKRVFECARLAPSANNAQPWHFYVVRQPLLKNKIAKMSYGHRFIAQAPLVVVCCGKSYAAPYSWLGHQMYLLDCAAAIDHLTLAARNEGLGTCWISDFDQEGIKRLLKLPKDYEVIMLTPLGWPATDNFFKEVRARRPLQSMVTEIF